MDGYISSLPALISFEVLASQNDCHKIASIYRERILRHLCRFGLLEWRQVQGLWSRRSQVRILSGTPFLFSWHTLSVFVSPCKQGAVCKFPLPESTLDSSSPIPPKFSPKACLWQVRLIIGGLFGGAVGFAGALKTRFDCLLCMSYIDLASKLTVLNRRVKSHLN